MNFDVELTGRKIVEVYRWFKKSKYDDPMHVNHYRIDIEKKAVNPNLIPKEVWDQYFQKTISIREESAEGMQETLTEMDKAKGENAAFESLDYPCECGQVFGNAGNLRLHKMGKAHKKAMATLAIPA